MKHRNTLPVALAALLACLAPAHAAVSAVMPFEASELDGVEKEFFADLDDGALDRYSLGDAFLIASGITEPDRFRLYGRKLDEIRAGAARELDRSKDPYLLGKDLLFWLHDNVLQTYRADATLATDILDRGTYNCLSASVLYTVLAADLGLRVKGVIVPDHAFCLLQDPRGDKDIETTVRYGFDPGTKEVEQLREATRYVYVPKKQYGKRKTVSSYQLVGALYSNRTGIFTRPGGGTGRKDLAKYKKGYYFDPGSEIFRTNIAACLNNMTIDEIRAGRFDEALVHIRQAKAFSPDPDAVGDLESQYYNEIARREGGRKDYRKAVEALREGLAANPSSRLLRHNLAYYYGLRAEQCGARKDYDGALAALEEGMKDLPGDRNLRIPFYNLAVDRYNARDFKTAREIAETGLRYFPGDQDLEKVRKSSRRLW